jgi:hypothetical protein
MMSDSRMIFSIRVVEKNSNTNKDISAENPAKIPKAFQEPRMFPVLPDNTPKDRALGKNKCTL